MTVHHDRGVTWLSFPVLDRYDFIVNGFSTRLGGVSEGFQAAMNLSFSRESDAGKVEENHRRLARAVGYDEEKLFCSAQTHSDHIREVTSADLEAGFGIRSLFPDNDAMMTNEPSLGLMVFIADCVPLLILDPEHRAIAAVHSGWKGTLSGIGSKTVRRMEERYGSDPEKMVAAIGPSICQDCYEVSNDLIEQFREVYPERLWDDLWKKGRTDEEGQLHWQLNLQKACRENFLRAGLKEENISMPDICTCCNPELLFSHRASQGRRGVLGAVIALKGKGSKKDSSPA